jgi:hypothetical protein
MQGGVQWWAILPYQACKQGEFGVTTKHARSDEMVGNFASQSIQQGHNEGDLG